MKLFLLSVLLFLFSYHVKAQDVSEINKVLEIPDTLKFEKEIRIYKNYSITNTMEIFRMYDEGNNNWIVIKYSYSKTLNQVTKIDELRFPKENIGKLKPKDAYLIWLNFLLTNMEFLPNMESIEYKLSTPFIDLEKSEKIFTRKKIVVTDGAGYQVYIKNGKIKNNFSFYNPETYLKHYPKVDELISYNELLSIMKKEFNLWND
ncbi:hypothetical protein [Flavobacterium piscis]|uniref:Uncharacterized protein n=1 Tax=Flavobacterium piscis TaxID=1114874 RepID=A0ABU1Y7Y1_9FLAO|nr:hypothetical protein [Flavobacterium piscis]MDR7209596.1 hypothetical protein [Flavobacterium piscis]